MYSPLQGPAGGSGHVLLLVGALGYCPSPAAGQTTPLDDFVYADDPSYGYSLVSQKPGDGFTSYRLLMTSGQWRDA